MELIVEAANEARARELAEGIMARSPNFVGVEVCEDGERLFGVGTLAERTVCGGAPQDQAGRSAA